MMTQRWAPLLLEPWTTNPFVPPLSVGLTVLTAQPGGLTLHTVVLRAQVAEDDGVGTQEVVEGRRVQFLI